MANDRYTGRSDDYGRRGPQDYTSDLQDGRGYGYSSARDYEAAERGGQRRRPTRGQHEGYSRGASSREGFDPVYGGAREDEHRMRRRAMRDLDMERRGHRPHIDNDPDYDPEHRGFFDRGISRLAGVALMNAQRLIDDPGRKGLERLLQTARIPDALAHAMMTAIDVAREMQYDGRPGDRIRYRSTLIERVLTQVEGIDSDNLDYLISRLASGDRAA